LAWWQAWAFLGVFAVGLLAITVYLMRHDPQLLERRLRAGPGAERERSQKIIQSFAALSFIAAILLPAIDHRLAWSAAPPAAALAGDALIALGFLITVLVFRENRFATAVIAIDAEQQVVSTGPYRLVRHPMYLGALIMMLGVAPALGSWWGLLAVVPFAAALAWRLVDEERILATRLPGYTDYQSTVRCRLIPRVW
jgi:protein-S-isoprenylcysteine O-methyltransferase Ste14